MKNLVTSLLAIAFVIVGSNIANMAGYSPPTNLQTVAASTVSQLPLNSMFNNVNKANPDTVHDTITVPCNHKPQPERVVVKTKIVKEKGISSLPLLYIATPVEGDSVDYAYDVHRIGK